MKRTLLLLLMGGSGFFGFAQKSYWKPVSENQAGKNLFEKEFKPSSYKLYQLQENVMRADLKNVPMEKTVRLSASSSIVTVPDAEGNLKSFRVVESPVMQPALAAKYPQLKSFIGRGIDDPSESIRFDLTPAGFHAMVTSPKSVAYYVNPIDQKSGIYVVNPRDPRDQSFFTCDVDGLISGRGATDKATQHTGNADDGILRHYKLALCVNGEYSQFWLDGTEPDTAAMVVKVMASLVTNLTRANEVYERDFGVRMHFVDNQDTLVFLDPETDPWPAKPPLFGSSWNKKTQTTIDSRIGSENYDIGHLLGKVPTFNDNNGNAGCIACVCKDGSKGSGFTAYYNPSLLDPMVIDYWTHEMGHQFGANHTFSFSNEGTGANVEPGSGSTIMGYAGITGSTDVQQHSDPYFHSVSVAQVSNYIKSSSGRCSVNETTGNTAPVVNAGSNFTVPVTTPFALTGEATDADEDDVLSYTWEQIDIMEKNGSNTFPMVTSTTGPVFRSLYNFTDPVRTFPNIETLREGLDANKWEALPAVGRQLNFRFTARDNHPGGGNNMSADVVITVDSTAGPFLITSQSEEGTEWKAGEEQTVTWDVANTDNGDINCKKVNILLSLDGGRTFRVVLAANTDNDGEEVITVPEVITDSARIKVEAVGNIFFDISDADIKVETVLPVNWLSLSAQAENGIVNIKWSTVNEINNDHFVVERSNDGVNFQSAGTVSAGNAPLQIQQYSFSDFKAIEGVNYYRIQQIDKDGKGSYSAIARVNIASATVSWSIQPNPAVNATVVLAKKELNNVRIELTNTSGKVVYAVNRTKVNAGEQLTIPVNNLAKGIYMIRLSSNEIKSTEKLVVQ